MPIIKSRLVVVGHSMGRAIVYSAFSQIFIDRLISSAPTINGFGDLVVLANPAMEAIQFSSLHEMVKEHLEKEQERLLNKAIKKNEAVKNKSERPPPVMVVFS